MLRFVSVLFLSLFAFTVIPSFARQLPLLPLSFEANQGQSDPSFPFQAKGPGYRIGLTANSAVFAGLPGNRRLVLRFPGAERVVGERPEARVSHYLHGSDPSRWRRNIRHYSQVRFPAVAPGIDAILYGNDGELEYDFLLAPGADPAQARLIIEGADTLTLSDDGSLQIRVGGLTLRHRAPVASQDGSPVPARFVIDHKQQSISFALGPYDRNRALVIDPVIEYSTYLGGAGGDGVSTITPLADGSFLIGGSVFQDYLGPISRLPGMPLPASPGDSEIFLLKLNAAKTQVLTSTYLGGRGTDGISSAAVDSAGNIYVAGNTTSTNFPEAWRGFVPLPVSPSPAGYPVYGGFICKLDPALAQILYSSFLPGPAIVAVSADGGAVVAGTTEDTRLPASNGAVQRVLQGRGDLFIIRVTPAGGLAAASYYGSAGSGETVQQIEWEPSGAIRIIGLVPESDIPRPPGSAPLPAGRQLIIARFNANLTAVTSLNSIPVEGAYEHPIARFTPNGGLAVFTTNIRRDQTTTPDAFQKTYGGPQDRNYDGDDDAFFRRYAPDLRTIEYATFLGGSSYDVPATMEVAPNGDIYLAGGTSSNDFPLTPNALFHSTMDEWRSINSGFLVRITPQNVVQLSTLISARGIFPFVMVPLGNGRVLLGGRTEPLHFPLSASPLQPLPGAGQTDGFLMQLDLDSPCVFNVSPPTLNAAATAGTYYFAVDAPANCPWSINSLSEWIVPNRTSQSQVSVRIPAIPHTYGRTGNLFVAGKTIPVNQSPAACTYTLLRPTVQVPAFGGSIEVEVNAPQGCTWQTVPADPWLSMRGGTIVAQVNYSPLPRTGRATVGGQTLTINQLGNSCTYSIAPSTLRIDHSGYTPLKINVVTQPDCRWDVIKSADSFIGGTTGETGPMQFSVFGFLNPGPERSEVITIAGRALTVIQDASPNNSNPTVSVTTPRATSGTRQSFTWTFTDTNGIADLGVANVLINSSLDGRNACYLAYDRPNNALYLVPDSGDGLIAGSLGAGTTIANSQCTVHLATSSVERDVSSFRLNLDISFSTAFSGHKIIYAAMRDIRGGNSGWDAVGTYGVRTPILANPAPVSITFLPIPATNDSYDVTIVYRDASAAANIRTTQLLINNALDGSRACYIGFDHTANVGYLIKDDGSGLLPTPVAPGTDSYVFNQRCLFRGAETSRTLSGNQLTLKLRLAIFGFPRINLLAFAGVQTLTGENSGWHPLVSWSRF